MEISIEAGIIMSHTHLLTYKYLQCSLLTMMAAAGTNDPERSRGSQAYIYIYIYNVIYNVIYIYMYLSKHIKDVNTIITYPILNIILYIT